MGCSASVEQPQTLKQQLTASLDENSIQSGIVKNRKQDYIEKHKEYIPELIKLRDRMIDILNLEPTDFMQNIWMLKEHMSLLSESSILNEQIIKFEQAKPQNKNKKQQNNIPLFPPYYQPLEKLLEILRQKYQIAQKTSVNQIINVINDLLQQHSPSMPRDIAQVLEQLKNYYLRDDNEYIEEACEVQIPFIGHFVRKEKFEATSLFEQNCVINNIGFTKIDAKQAQVLQKQLVIYIFQKCLVGQIAFPSIVVRIKHFNFNQDKELFYQAKFLKNDLSKYLSEHQLNPNDEISKRSYYLNLFGSILTYPLETINNPKFIVNENAQIIRLFEETEEYDESIYEQQQLPDIGLTNILLQFQGMIFNLEMDHEFLIQELLKDNYFGLLQYALEILAYNCWIFDFQLLNDVKVIQKDQIEKIYQSLIVLHNLTVNYSELKIKQKQRIFAYEIIQQFNPVVANFSLHFSFSEQNKNNIDKNEFYTVVKEYSQNYKKQEIDKILERKLNHSTFSSFIALNSVKKKQKLQPSDNRNDIFYLKSPEKQQTMSPQKQQTQLSPTKQQPSSPQKTQQYSQQQQNQQSPQKQGLSHSQSQQTLSQQNGKSQVENDANPKNFTIEQIQFKDFIGEEQRKFYNKVKTNYQAFNQISQWIQSIDMYQLDIWFEDNAKLFYFAAEHFGFCLRSNFMHHLQFHKSWYNQIRMEPVYKYLMVNPVLDKQKLIDFTWGILGLNLQNDLEIQSPGKGQQNNFKSGLNNTINVKMIQQQEMTQSTLNNNINQSDIQKQQQQSQQNKQENQQQSQQQKIQQSNTTSKSAFDQFWQQLNTHIILDDDLQVNSFEYGVRVLPAECWSLFLEKITTYESNKHIFVFKYNKFIDEVYLKLFEDFENISFFQKEEMVFLVELIDFQLANLVIQNTFRDILKFDKLDFQLENTIVRIGKQLFRISLLPKEIVSLNQNFKQSQFYEFTYLLNEEQIGQKIIFDMLLFPQNHEVKNMFLVNQNVNKQSNSEIKNKNKNQGIGENKIMIEILQRDVNPFSQKLKKQVGNKFQLNMKSNLFAFNFMNKNITPALLAYFIELDIYKLIREFLEALQNSSAKLTKFLEFYYYTEDIRIFSKMQDQKEQLDSISKQTQKTLFLNKYVVRELLQRVFKLKNILEFSEQITYKQLLFQFEPTLTEYYKVVYKYFEDIKKPANNSSKKKNINNQTANNNNNTNDTEAELQKKQQFDIDQELQRIREEFEFEFQMIKTLEMYYFKKNSKINQIQLGPSFCLLELKKYNRVLPKTILNINNINNDDDLIYMLQSIQREYFQENSSKEFYELLLSHLNKKFLEADDLQLEFEDYPLILHYVEKQILLKSMVSEIQTYDFRQNVKILILNSVKIPDLTNEDLKLIQQLFPNLEHLDLSQNNCITRFTANLSDYQTYNQSETLIFPNLKYLFLEQCSQLLAIDVKSDCLEIISAGQSSKIQHLFVNSSKNIKIINLKRCMEVNFEAISCHIFKETQILFDQNTSYGRFNKSLSTEINLGKRISLCFWQIFENLQNQDILGIIACQYNKGGEINKELFGKLNYNEIFQKTNINEKIKSDLVHECRKILMKNFIQNIKVDVFQMYPPQSLNNQNILIKSGLRAMRDSLSELKGRSQVVKIKTLDITKCLVDINAAQHIKQILSLLRSDNQLSLQVNCIEARTHMNYMIFHEICQGILAMPQSLMILDISNITFNQTLTDILAELIADSNFRVKKIFLKNCAIKDDDLGPLCEVLSQSKYIKFINFSVNNISMNGVKNSIFSMLYKNRKIKGIDLSQNDLYKITELDEMKHLRYIALRGNNFHHEEYKEISKFLKLKDSKVEVIDLCNNYIDELSVKDFSLAVVSNKTLKDFKIDWDKEKYKQETNKMIETSFRKFNLEKSKRDIKDYQKIALSMDGIGLRQYFPIVILEFLLKQLHKKLTDVFDLVSANDYCQIVALAQILSNDNNEPLLSYKNQVSMLDQLIKSQNEQQSIIQQTFQNQRLYKFNGNCKLVQIEHDYTEYYKRDFQYNPEETVVDYLNNQVIPSRYDIIDCNKQNFVTQPISIVKQYINSNPDENYFLFSLSSRTEVTQYSDANFNSYREQILERSWDNFKVYQNFQENVIESDQNYFGLSPLISNQKVYKIGTDQVALIDYYKQLAQKEANLTFIKEEKTRFADRNIVQWLIENSDRKKDYYL